MAFLPAGDKRPLRQTHQTDPINFSDRAVPKLGIFGFDAEGPDRVPAARCPDR